MNETEINDDSVDVDKLLAELEKEDLSENSDTEKIKDKQAGQTLNKLKYEKPDWADKKDDDYNSYDYSEKEVDDIDW